MTLVIATATPLEMKAVLAGFNGRGRICCGLPAQGETCSLPVNDRDCLLLVTGVGPVNAALSLGRALGAHPGIRGVLNLGVAGTFDILKAPLGCAVLATNEAWPEYGLAGDEGTDPNGIAFPQAQGPEGPVWDRIPIAPERLFDNWRLAAPTTVRAGASVTVAGVSGTAARAATLRKRYGALMENMEGFSLALGCLHHGLPFAEVRTISNIVGSRAAEDWALDGALAALGTLARELFATD